MSVGQGLPQSLPPPVSMRLVAPSDPSQVPSDDASNLAVMPSAKAASVRYNHKVDCDEKLRTSGARARFDVMTSTFWWLETTWHRADFSQLVRRPTIVLDDGESDAEISAGRKGHFLNPGGLTWFRLRLPRKKRSCFKHAGQGVPLVSSIRASSTVLMVKPTRSPYLLATLAAVQVIRVWTILSVGSMYK